MAAKILFTLVFINLPLFLYQAAIVIAAGLPLPQKLDEPGLAATILHRGRHSPGGRFGCGDQEHGSDYTCRTHNSGGDRRTVKFRVVSQR
jgi:hypothetical protein